MGCPIGTKSDSLRARKRSTVHSPAVIVMGSGFRKLFQLGPGLRVNLSRRGAGLSPSVKGFIHSLGLGRRRTPISASGTRLALLHLSAQTAERRDRLGHLRSHRPRDDLSVDPRMAAALRLSSACARRRRADDGTHPSPSWRRLCRQHPARPEPPAPQVIETHRHHCASFVVSPPGEHLKRSDFMFRQVVH
jgi:Protein of unknown function (DUF4236)